MKGWRAPDRPLQLPKNPCAVRSVIRGYKCGFPNYAWTNHMESLCKEHHYQRRVIQNLLVMMSGYGSWGSLIMHNVVFPRMLEMEE